MCEHSLVFNYAGGKSQCGECGQELIKSKQGQYLRVEALEDMYEALKVLFNEDETLNLHPDNFKDIKQALAKVEGND